MRHRRMRSARSGSRRSRGLAAVLVGLSLAGVTGCGGQDSSTEASGSTSGERAIRVGLVTDSSGLEDRSFNQLANEGLMRAERELGVEGRVLVSRSTADYVPNLSALARQRYDLVIGVSFLLTDAMDEVARRYPQTRFALVDGSQSQLKTRPPNVRGLLFEEQQAGYLAGYLAGLYARDHGVTAVSSVGGQKIPPVDRYIAGFQAGARAAEPGVRVLNGYAQDFVDQAKCKEQALNQIAEGSAVVFPVAGACGLGALDAARERGVKAIGVDADQTYLGPHLLTSAVKKVDVAVFKTIQDVRRGTFEGGTDAVFDLRAGGVDIGPLGRDARRYEAAIARTRKQLAAGRAPEIPQVVR